MAIYAALIVERKLGLSLNEAEIGFLALHFALAVERSKNQSVKKNIIIVCASGAGSSQILLYKIQQKFKAGIGEIRVSELYELENLQQEDYDFILTTVPILFATRIPTIQVNYFLDETDVGLVSKKLQESGEANAFIDEYFQEELFFTDLKGQTKAELIAEMCQRTRAWVELPVDFEASVLERETFAATEFGNSVAIPHPMRPMSPKTFCSIGLLSKGITWEQRKVKYIFLLGIETEASGTVNLFNDAIAALVLDQQLMSKFAKKPTLSNLKLLIQQMVEVEKENDIDSLFT